MKGPGFRLDLDVRRVWECPACGRREKMPADVTQLACVCRPEPPWMRLVEGLRRTESPFDQVAFQAQKRIDAVIKKPYGPPPVERPVDDLVEVDHEDLPGANAGSEIDSASRGEREEPPEPDGGG